MSRPNEGSVIIGWTDAVQLNRFDVLAFRIPVASQQHTIAGCCVQPCAARATTPCQNDQPIDLRYRRIFLRFR